MSSEQRSRRLASLRRVVFGLALAALIMIPGLRCARADFVTPYATSDFMVVNSTFANGSLRTPDAGRSIVVTGPNDGSGLAGRTDATVICRGAGTIRFRFAFATSDAPGFDSAGYLLNGAYTVLASADNSSGAVSVNVSAGDVFGFRAESLDNTGEPGILTITEVSFPPSATITSVRSDPNPSVVRQAVSLVATVGSAVGLPGGSVVFKDGAATLGTAPLSGGQAQLIVSTLNLGDHSITAVYVGNASFASSTSSPVTQTVRAGATVTTLSSSSRTSVFGQSVTLSAAVAPVLTGTGSPTGAVSFSEGSSVIGTAVLNGAGVATFTVASLSVGSHTLTAAYGSDGAYLASTSAPLVQTVNTAATATSLSSSAVIVTKGQSVTFTATVAAVAPGAGAPSGSIVFKDGAATLGASALNSSSSAALTVDSLAAGTHVVTAVYGGEGNFKGSTSSSISETVNKASTTTTLAPVTGPVLAGDCVTASATVTSQGGIPTGIVEFRSGSSLLATSPVSGFGTATTGRLCLGVGNYLLTAHYLGDANFFNSSSPGAPFDVAPIPTTVAEPVLRSGNPLAGEPLSLEARVTGERSPVGSVRFYDGYISLGTSPVDPQGVSTLTARLGVGLHLVTASYEGDAMHASSRSDPLFLRVRGIAKVEVISSANPSDSVAEVIFSASVTAPQGASVEPTGDVIFLDGTTRLGTGALEGGRASLKVSGLAAGEHAIVASYSGDANYVASLSASVNQRVARALSTTELDAGVDAEGYFLTAQVACSPTAGYRPTGSVQFDNVSQNLAIGSAPLGNGSATMRLASPVSIGVGLRAAYTGDAVCGPSNSGVLPIIVAANGFSFSTAGFAPGAITSVFGKGLSEATVAAPSGPLPRTLDGLAVEIIDASGSSHRAGLYFVSPTQANFVVPAGVPSGPARLMLTKAGAPTGALRISISGVAPGLASLNGSGAGVAAAHFIRVHADGSQDQPVPASTAAQAFGADGDRLYVVFYGTGIRNAGGLTTCTLNGESLPALYSGPHPVYEGLDQINLELPMSLRGAAVVTVNCTVDGHTTNNVSINVQ